MLIRVGCLRGGAAHAPPQEFETAALERVLWQREGFPDVDGLRLHRALRGAVTVERERVGAGGRSRGLPHSVEGFNLALSPAQVYPGLLIRVGCLRGGAAHAPPQEFETAALERVLWQREGFPDVDGLRLHRALRGAVTVERERVGAGGLRSLPVPHGAYEVLFCFVSVSIGILIYP